MSVQIEFMDKIFTPVQKEEIISKISGATILIKGVPKRSAAWLSIEEICSGEWRIG